MTHSLYISTTEAGSGKALVSLGILELVLRRTTKVHFFRPVIQPPTANGSSIQDEDIQLMRHHFRLRQTYEESYGLLATQANDLMGQHRMDEALDIIMGKFNTLMQRGDFVLCEGSDYMRQSSAFEFNFNEIVARNLGCPILVVGNADQRPLDDTLSTLQLAVDAYQDHQCQIFGLLLNKASDEHITPLHAALHQRYGQRGWLLGVLPHHPHLSSPRLSDIVDQLGADVLYGSQRLDALVTSTLVAAMQLQHALTWVQPQSLVITPGDRADILVGMVQAHQSTRYPPLAGILLTGALQPDPAITRLLDGLATPLPVLAVHTDTFTTVAQVRALRSALRAGDGEKTGLGIKLFDQHVNMAHLERLISTVQAQGMTPKRFTYSLLQQAKDRRQKIVLPEGTDPRILQAAAALVHQQVVSVVLLGDPKAIQGVVNRQGIPLDLALLTIIDPAHSPDLARYANTLFQLRQHKGITPDMALDMMMDGAYYGTMMVYLGDADGMVSGAVHTTQHTIRPALQIIKTRPGCSLVSSIFFMCLEHRVLVYGDCAVNPNPDPDQLAEIAIASAETARAFGIEPRVAMLSYSSGESGQGDDVESVRAATALAQQQRPDLKLAGPIQYDAAVDPTVGAQKMKDCDWAGQATVLIFPDLNTGNNTYKAVQRETGAIAIGPVLQGLKKPVNDLSRGCTVEDIINTVAITAIQAQARH